MIGIGRHTDYAARLVLHLACLPAGTRVSVREIAERRALPQPFVRRIVSHLVSAGLVRSARGFQGGLELARPASDITLLDVVAALEGSVGLSPCLDHREGCPFSGACPVRGAWAQVSEDLRNSLASVRFDELARREAGHVEAHRADLAP